MQKIKVRKAQGPLPTWWGYTLPGKHFLKTEEPPVLIMKLCFMGHVTKVITKFPKWGCKTPKAGFDITKNKLCDGIK